LNAGVIHQVRLPSGDRADLAFADGHIVSEAPAGAVEIDGEHYVALPRLADSHLHLDKALLGPKWTPHREGPGIGERIRLEVDTLASPEVEDTYTRGERLLKMAICNGSTRLRSHVDISAGLGLSRLDALLRLRDDYQDAVDLTFVAFPQEGILASPGTAELLVEALARGVEAIGGLDPVTRDGNMDAQLDVVFGLAYKFGRHVDIHLHDPAEVGTATMREIASRTKALGMHGRVAISHGYALAMVNRSELERTVAALVHAGVSLISNVPGQEPRPPYDVLEDLGLNVVFASDNVRDSWSPYGKADMLERVALAGYLCGWNGDDQLLSGLDHVTTAASFTLGDEPALLRQGDPADFTLVPAHSLQEAIVSQPVGRIIYRHGCVVAAEGSVLSTHALR
jgi:cytosine/creatinine deaminase